MALYSLVTCLLNVLWNGMSMQVLKATPRIRRELLELHLLLLLHVQLSDGVVNVALLVFFARNVLDVLELVFEHLLLRRTFEEQFVVLQLRSGHRLRGLKPVA